MMSVRNYRSLHPVRQEEIAAPGQAGAPIHYLFNSDIISTLGTNLAFTPLVIPFLITVVITLTIAVYAVRLQRQVPQARAFAFLAGSEALWAGCYIPVLLYQDLPSKLLWIKIMYVGTLLTSIALLQFTLKYTRQTRFSSPTAKTIYFGAAALVLLAVVTDPFHHQLWKQTSLVNGALENAHGPVYWIVLGYPYALTLASLVLLVRSYFNSVGKFRTQAGLLVLGVLIPILVSVISDVFGLVPVPQFDASTFSLVFTCTLFAYAIFRFQVLDLMPLAYSAIVHNIRDAVLVFDLQNRIVFFNHSAGRKFGLQAKDTSLALFDDLLKCWSPSAWESWKDGQTEFEISLEGDNGIESNFLSFTPLLAKSGEVIGLLLLVYDISERKLLESQLHNLAISDPLTGCFNSRHFMHLAALEDEKVRRNKRPLSIFLIDLDFFKQINDRHGHRAGDQVLKRTVEVCQANIRRTDLFARFGGDEFVVLLPETDIETALQVAHRVHLAIQEMITEVDGHEIRITASIGLASLDVEAMPSLDCMVSDADAAMYTSKQSGRNCVHVFEKG
jgi:diguanylate cyclase (GGDEF)-like protein